MGTGHRRRSAVLFPQHSFWHVSGTAGQLFYRSHHHAPMQAQMKEHYRESPVSGQHMQVSSESPAVIPISMHIFTAIFGFIPVPPLPFTVTFSLQNLPAMLYYDSLRYPSPSSHCAISSAASATSLSWTVNPSVTTVASGSSFAIVSIVPEKRLPLWELKGMMVFPEKSYSSKKLYSTMGMSYHQLGYENLYQGRFSFIYQHFNTIHTSFYNLYAKGLILSPNPTFPFLHDIS